MTEAAGATEGLGLPCGTTSLQATPRPGRRAGPGLYAHLGEEAAFFQVYPRLGKALFVKVAARFQACDALNNGVQGTRISTHFYFTYLAAVVGPG